MMLRPQPDKNPEARGVLLDTPATIPATPDRHWYVDSTDYPGFCAACALPPSNGRHASRGAA